MKKELSVLLAILMAMSASACEVVKGDIEVNTGQPGEELVTPIPDAFIEETPVNNLILDPEELTPEQQYEIYREMLYKSKEEDLFLKFGILFYSTFIWELIGIDYSEGKYTVDDIVEANQLAMGGYDLNDVHIKDDSIKIFYNLPNDDGVFSYEVEFHDSKKQTLQEISVAKDYMVLNHFPIEYYERYDDSISSFINTIGNVDRYIWGWNGGITFFDRVFYEIDENGYVVDIEGLLFTIDLIASTDQMLFDVNMSSQEKIDYIYNNIYLNTELTPFEKAELLHRCEGYFIMIQKEDTFILVPSGANKSIRDLVSDSRVDTLEELAGLQAQSDAIIAEARDNYPLPPNTNVANDITDKFELSECGFDDIVEVQLNGNIPDDVWEKELLKDSSYAARTKALKSFKEILNNTEFVNGLKTKDDSFDAVVEIKFNLGSDGLDELASKLYRRSGFKFGSRAERVEHVMAELLDLGLVPYDSEITGKTGNDHDFIVSATPVSSEGVFGPYITEEQRADIQKELNM